MKKNLLGIVLGLSLITNTKAQEMDTVALIGTGVCAVAGAVVATKIISATADTAAKATQSIAKIAQRVWNIASSETKKTALAGLTGCVVALYAQRYFGAPSTTCLPNFFTK